MNKWIFIFLATMMCACQQEVKNAIKVDEMPPIYPDYIGVTIPVGIAPLNFDSEKEAERMDVVVKGSQQGELHVQGKYAAFDVEDWHQLLQANQGGKLTFSVCIQQKGQWYRYQDFEMQISSYALEDYGLTYRRIAPGYEVYSHMGLYERELATFEERAIIENTQVPGMCVNCHTPNRTNPDAFVFHVRGSHGTTLVQRDGQFEVLKAQNDSIKGSMVYPYWP